MCLEGPAIPSYLWKPGFVRTSLWLTDTTAKPEQERMISPLTRERLASGAGDGRPSEEHDWFPVLCVIEARVFQTRRAMTLLHLGSAIYTSASLELVQPSGLV